MATTINRTTDAASNRLNVAPTGAWLAVIAGATTTASFIQARGGGSGLEWVEGATASPPAATVVGHDIKDGEQQVLEALAAGQSYFIRALGPGFTRAVITPGTAAA